MNLNRIYNIR